MHVLVASALHDQNELTETLNLLQHIIAQGEELNFNYSTSSLPLS